MSETTLREFYLVILDKIQEDTGVPSFLKKKIIEQMSLSQLVSHVNSRLVKKIKKPDQNYYNDMNGKQIFATHMVGTNPRYGIINYHKHSNYLANYFYFETEEELNECIKNHIKEIGFIYLDA